MMINDSLITLSVLVTKEEYSKAYAEVKRKERSHLLPLIKTGGVLLLICGLAGAFFGKRISLSISAVFCMMILGSVLLFYNRLFAPILDNAAGSKEYDEKEYLHFATMYQFTEESVQVSNGHMEGSLPLSLVTSWVDLPMLILLSFGREMTLSIPKRLLDKKQYQLILEILKKNTKETRL